jgi:hypothetical protein
MGWFQRAVEFVSGGPSVPDDLVFQALERGYQLACTSLNSSQGPVAIATAITRAGEIKSYVAADGNPQSAQGWISEGIAARQFAHVCLFMTLRAEDPQVCERLLACYMDNPGRGPASLALRPIVLTDGVVSLGAMTVEVSDVRIAI